MRRPTGAGRQLSRNRCHSSKQVSEKIGAVHIRKYPEDGEVFKNREGLLPEKPPGYYTAWTVDTPGLSYRGKRRAVRGAEGELYYTDDHYRSFVRIEGGQ